MSIVVLKLPDVKRTKEARPKKCTYCAGITFQGWGQVTKPVKDVRVRQVQVYRYRGCHCKRTFRHDPQGNSKADQTERLRVFAILLCPLGLSYRASSLILSGLKGRVSFMTIWRDVQEEAQQMKKRNHWKPVRSLGLDGAKVLGWGEKQPVRVAVDLGTGERLPIGYLNEYDPQAVQGWLEPLVQRQGMTVIVTDDLSSYKVVAEKLQLAHPVCQFPVRRWVGKALKEVQETIPKEWRWVLDEIQQVLHLLPPDGNKTLYALWKKLPGRRTLPNQSPSALEQLRNLLLRLSEDWHTYCTFQFEPEVP